MNKNKPIAPERAIQILAKHNVKVTSEQAEKILKFMNKFAHIAIDVYVKSDITNTEHQKK